MFFVTLVDIKVDKDIFFASLLIPSFHSISIINSLLSLQPGATLTVRPVRLEPPQYFWFTNRGHFLKSPKYAIKIDPKKSTPLEPHQYFRAYDATGMYLHRSKKFSKSNTPLLKPHNTFFSKLIPSRLLGVCTKTETRTSFYMKSSSPPTFWIQIQKVSTYIRDCTEISFSINCFWGIVWRIKAANEQKEPWSAR